MISYNSILRWQNTEYVSFKQETYGEACNAPTGMTIRPSVLNYIYELEKVLGRPVRATKHDRQVAVVDVIMAVCFANENGGLKSSAQKNASDYFKLLMTKHQSLSKNITMFRFKGQGQKATPVIAIADIPVLMSVLIGKMRKSLEWKRHDLFKIGLAIEDKVSVRVFVECEVMEQLLKAFLACSPVQQYKVGPYKVDMYLPKANIVVECDEYDHQKYNVVTEKNRQFYIEKQLQCRFVRFDPYNMDFDIMSVIAAVVKLLTSAA